MKENSLCRCLLYTNYIFFFINTLLICLYIKTNDFQHIVCIIMNGMLFRLKKNQIKANHS